MDISECNAIETKERALQADLNAQLRRITEIQSTLRAAISKKERCEIDFQRLKQQLLDQNQTAKFAGTQKQLQGLEGLQHLGAMATQLRGRKELLLKLEQENQLLLQRYQGIGATFLKTKAQIEKLSAHMKNEKQVEKARDEARENEEAIELRSIQTQDIDPISLLDESAPVQPQTVDPIGFQTDTSRNPTQDQPSPEPTPSEPTEPNPRSGQSFEQEQPAHQSLTMNDLKSWSGMQGDGVSFSVQSKSGRDLLVTITGSGDQHVRVKLFATDERDRRVLWEEKRELLEALREGGYHVDEVIVRRGKA